VAKRVTVVGLVLAACAVVVFFLAGSSRINSIGGRTIRVEFRDAAGVTPGIAVYSGGIEVGQVLRPQVMNGRATVPVRLYRGQDQAIASGTVFLISEDPNRPGQHCLLGYAVSFSPDPSRPDEVYSGAASRLEMIALIGLDKVRKYLQ
jgi:hypothetical protein